MWVVVYIAPNRRVAMFLKELLEFEGIPVKLSESKCLTKEEKNIEVMVSEMEIEEANEVINHALQRS